MKDLQIHFVKVLAILLILVFAACNKKTEQIPENNSGKEFSWKPELRISDIPDFPVKGFIEGKEIRFDYINLEQWRGSGDNVLNFGDTKPKNNCGYIEGDNSFHLVHKGDDIKAGELLKATFEQNLDGYTAYYNTTKDSLVSNKSSSQWNCALVITAMEEKTVKGKIVICFKDEKKSWIAGTFEAIRCNN